MIKPGRDYQVVTNGTTSTLGRANISQSLSLSVCQAANISPPVVLTERAERSRPSSVISSVRSSSLGEYSCLAKNKFGSDSVTLTVVDERKIIVTEPPQYSVVTAGQTARLRCGGHSALGTVKYRWWKGNTAVEEVGLLQGRVRLGQAGGVSQLELQDVHRDDAGVYLCQLSNEHDQQEVQAEISVLEEAARVVFTPRQVHLRLGEAGTVPCYIRPSFYLTTWTRQSSPPLCRG